MSTCEERHEKEMQRRTREEMRRCVHFNGVMNAECNAGVNYHELLGDGVGCFAHMPCFSDEQSKVRCDKAEFLSESEARAKVDAHEIYIQEFIQQLNNSICPTCKVQVKQKQIGPCVYGTCGHRLYQGKVNPEFAYRERKIRSTRRLDR